MTAAEACALTNDSKDNYALAAIREAARGCLFKVEIRDDRLTKRLEDKLVSDGFSISRRDRGYVVIDWSAPAEPNKPPAAAVL